MWFIYVDNGVRCYDRQAVTPAKLTAIKALRDCGSITGWCSKCDWDSLDACDIMLEIEEMSGYRIPDESMARFRCWGDAVDYIIRDLPDAPEQGHVRT